MHLTKAEKEQRADFFRKTEGDKTEFINGEIILHGPDTFIHNIILGNLYTIFSFHVIGKNLGFLGSHKIATQFSKNIYSPDLCYFLKSKSENFKNEQYLFPTPDLIVEILSEETESRDRGIKFQDYQNHGVAEYWIVDAKSKVIEQYLLKENQYELALKSHSGNIVAQVIPNLSIPIPVIFDKKETNRFIRSM